MSDKEISTALIVGGNLVEENPRRARKFAHSELRRELVNMGGTAATVQIVKDGVRCRAKLDSVTFAFRYDYLFTAIAKVSA